MSIPESQLETWSHQGSVSQSSSTYQSIKRVLEDSGTPYANKSFEVFLQGSYGNDTNIYAESDVDLVIRLDSTYYDDVTNLSKSEQVIYKSQTTSATYGWAQFKDDVVEVLKNAYGSDVSVGDKAIQIAARGSRRKADVIVASQFRNYKTFRSSSDQDYIEGIQFWTLQGIEIINYPKQHSVNLTQKHRDTYSWYKPVVRIFKNMRSKMVDKNIIKPNTAPSYYIEGLIYNVPIEHFGRTYEDTVVNSLNWIITADRDKFVCANEQYYLCHPFSPVTWRTEKRDEFINGAIQLWKNW